MAKPREDLFKKYWDLIDELDWESEEEDFYTEETLKQAIEKMENAKRTLPEGDLSTEE